MKKCLAQLKKTFKKLLFKDEKLCEACGTTLWKFVRPRSRGKQEVFYAHENNDCPLKNDGIKIKTEIVNEEDFVKAQRRIT